MMLLVVIVADPVKLRYGYGRARPRSRGKGSRAQQKYGWEQRQKGKGKGTQDSGNTVAMQATCIDAAGIQLIRIFGVWLFATVLLVWVISV
jgi:hypothetical protein